jgi:hypothetical protein
VTADGKGADWPCRLAGVPGGSRPSLAPGPDAPLRRFQPKQNFCFSPRCSADFASFGVMDATMRTMFVILLLALTAITFEIYSDVALTSVEFSRSASPDAATVAVAHGLKRG